jgi:hypothetical protein
MVLVTETGLLISSPGTAVMTSVVGNWGKGSIDLYAINLKKRMCLAERTLIRLKLSEQA